MLSSAQSKRLEDQRGVQISTGELPSFLCPPTSQAADPAVEEVHLQQPLTSSMTMFDDVEAISGAGFLEKGRSSKNAHRSSPAAFASTPRDGKTQTMGTPWSDKWKPKDRSFSQEGIIPSPREAEAYFRMSPVVVDSNKSSVSKSLDFSALSNNTNHGSGKSTDEMVGGDLSFAKSRLEGNVSAHFSGSHVFRPVYLSANGSRAPVASPEKFSPESKKPRSSPDGRFPLKTSPLPDKVIPPTRSSSASSNMSGQESTAHPTLSPSPSPVFHQPASHNMTRLSDGMLMHRLQQARMEKENRYTGGQAMPHSTSHRPIRPSSVEHPHALHNKENQLFMYRKNSRSSPMDHEMDRPPPSRPDLTPSQRALLSPRFEQSSSFSHPIQTSSGSGQAMSSFFPPRHSAEPPAYPSQTVDPPSHHPMGTAATALAQSALVSPRYNLSPVSKQYHHPDMAVSKAGVPAQSRIQHGQPFSRGVPRPFDIEGVEEIVTFV